MASFCDGNQRYLFVLVCSVLNCYHALIFFLGILDVCVDHHAYMFVLFFLYFGVLALVFFPGFQYEFLSI